MKGVLTIMSWKKEPLAERLMRSLRLLNIHGVITDAEFRRAVGRWAKKAKAVREGKPA